VWSGLYRGWTTAPQPVRAWGPAAPWGAAFALVLMADRYLRSAGILLPGAAVLAPAGVCCALALSVVVLRRPRWALPPSYRRRVHGPDARAADQAPGRAGGDTAA
jgi:hypothetical protein